MFSRTKSARAWSGSALCLRSWWLMAQQCTLQFLGDSNGGTSQVELDFDHNPTLDISGHNPRGVTIGSLNGLNGTISLGANTLTMGNNNLTSSYSGLIEGSGLLTKMAPAPWLSKEVTLMLVEPLSKVEF
jgi:hypothetical protein